MAASNASLGAVPNDADHQLVTRACPMTRNATATTTPIAETPKPVNAVQKVKIMVPAMTAPTTIK